MNEKFIAGYEYWKEKMQDDYDEELVKLREQIVLLKEHASSMEVVIRHIGIEIQEMKKKIK